MAQVTNKCTNSDLEFFVRECGDILGLNDKVKNRNDPKAIVSYVLEQLVTFFFSFLPLDIFQEIESELKVKSLF